MEQVQIFSSRSPSRITEEINKWLKLHSNIEITARLQNTAPETYNKQKTEYLDEYGEFIEKFPNITITIFYKE